MQNRSYPRSLLLLNTLQITKCGTSILNLFRVLLLCTNKVKIMYSVLCISERAKHVRFTSVSYAYDLVMLQVYYLLTAVNLRLSANYNNVNRLTALWSVLQHASVISIGKYLLIHWSCQGVVIYAPNHMFQKSLSILVFF
jgi:hypothetical protein